jgi:hypothetical protein
MTLGHGKVNEQEWIAKQVMALRGDLQILRDDVSVLTDVIRRGLASLHERLNLIDAMTDPPDQYGYVKSGHARDGDTERLVTLRVERGKINARIAMLERRRGREPIVTPLRSHGDDPSAEDDDLK